MTDREAEFWEGKGPREFYADLRKFAKVTWEKNDGDPPQLVKVPLLGFLLFVGCVVEGFHSLWWMIQAGFYRTKRPFFNPEGVVTGFLTGLVIGIWWLQLILRRFF